MAGSRVGIAENVALTLKIFSEGKGEQVLLYFCTLSGCFFILKTQLFHQGRTFSVTEGGLCTDAEAQKEKGGGKIGVKSCCDRDYRRERGGY